LKAITKRSETKQPNCKIVCGFQESYDEKRCVIKSVGQEMAVMVNGKNFDNGNSGEFDAKF